MTSDETDAARATGGCLCGAVRYEVRGAMRGVLVCHCGQCQRTHGGPGAYSNTAKGDLVLNKARGLRWYRSSQRARRGFCGECGASLFWERIEADTISVSAGTIDPPSGLETIGHIYLEDKRDFYEITDGLPQRPRGQAG